MSSDEISSVEALSSVRSKEKAKKNSQIVDPMMAQNNAFAMINQVGAYQDCYGNYYMAPTYQNYMAPPYQVVQPPPRLTKFEKISIRLGRAILAGLQLHNNDLAAVITAAKSQSTGSEADIGSLMNIQLKTQSQHPIKSSTPVKKSTLANDPSICMKLTHPPQNSPKQ